MHNAREAQPSRAASQLERQLVEGRAAIELVARGGAVRVQLHGLTCAERIAAPLASHAQQAGVAFRLERHGERPASLIVGPRLAARSR